ncbi:hypothetical protein ABPG74_004812 [Tetrahymena malaccensis]
MEALHSLQISQKVQKYISQLRFCRSKKKQQITGIENQQLKQIFLQMNKELNILNLYQDIQFIKKAIMIILTSDQLAALQLVGISQNFLNLDINDVECFAERQKDLNLSHYEIQFGISQSQKLQSIYLDKFLQKCNNNKDLKQIDQRILSSFKMNKQID